MSVISFIRCRINRHKPVRSLVKWDGQDYVSTCRYCGTPIYRHGRKDWRQRKQDAVREPDAAA